MEKRIEDILPIIGVERDCIISAQGDITVAYKVDLPEIFTLSNEEYEAFHHTWVKAIKVLPKFSVFYKQDWFTGKKFKPEEGEDEKTFLSRSSDRFFNERPYLDHSCYIYLTKKAEGRRSATSLVSNLLRKSIVPDQTLNVDLLERFLDVCGQFKQVVEDSGFVKLTRLHDRDILSDHRKIGLIEKYCMLNQQDNSFMMKDIKLDDGLQVGDQHCLLFTLGDVVDLPALCGPRINYEKYSTEKTKFSLGFAGSLGQLLPYDHMYSQYIFIEDANKTLQKLEAKRLRLQSLSGYSRENLIARDAANDFLNEAISMQRLPVKAHYNVLVWTADKTELKEIRNVTASALAQMDSAAKIETVGQAQIFWAGIPGNAADFPLNDTFDTFLEQATCFLNKETSYKSSLSPTGIRLGDRLTGRPVHVDIDDEPKAKGIIQNYNAFILSGSGGGKSYFTNHLVRSYYEQGTHVVIVDVGHSYEILCNMVGGYYFTYEEGNPIKFNPFFIGPDDILDTETKESIKTLLLALWKKDTETYRRSDYVALSTALTLYFEKLEKEPGMEANFNTFYEFLREDFAALMKQEGVKEKEFDLYNFLYVMKPYYKGGEFDYLLNARENLDMLNERFIVFELDNLAGHPVLFPVTTLIIMNMFVSKMRKLKGIRKMIVIEEAWKAIAKEGMAEYIKYLYKTARKFFAKTVTVTQEADDITSSEIIKNAIINNSDCKILLDQSKFINRFDEIQAVMGISEKQKAEIFSINKSQEPGRIYKDSWICLGTSHSKVYRLETSLEEYYTYTSEQKEKLMVKNAVARFGGDYRKAIAWLADQKRQKAA